MQFDFSLFLCAVGLAFVFESCLYALFPEFMKRMLTHMSVAPASSLRNWGLGGLGLGLFIVWLARSLA